MYRDLREIHRVRGDAGSLSELKNADKIEECSECEPEEMEPEEQAPHVPDYYSELYDATGELRTVVSAMVVDEACRVSQLISLGELRALQYDLEPLLETLAEPAGRIVRERIAAKIQEVEARWPTGATPASPMGLTHPPSGPSAALRQAANAALAKMVEKYNTQSDH